MDSESLCPECHALLKLYDNLVDSDQHKFPMNKRLRVNGASPDSVSAVLGCFSAKNVSENKIPRLVNLKNTSSPREDENSSYSFASKNLHETVTQYSHDTSYARNIQGVQVYGWGIHETPSPQGEIYTYYGEN